MRTLSITIGEELYNNLKHAIPSRQISKFASEALSEKLDQRKEMLYRAYLEASHDEDREADLKEWDTISLETWDKETEEQTRLQRPPK